MLNQKVNQFYQMAERSDLKPYLDLIRTATNNVIANINQGDLPKWLSAYSQLPDINNSSVNYEHGPLTVEFEHEIPDEKYQQLVTALKSLSPWRKGPFLVGQCLIDSEWQSNLKWNRIKNALPEMKNKMVLDVGCGNGYYLMKLSQYHPDLLIGIDPGLLHNVQFWSVEKYAQTGAYVLPLKIQEFPTDLNCFDVVFSMGVLYHRKSPIEHIEHLKSLMKPGATLILETLIVDGDEHTCLVPKGRYAQMRNVWFLPSVTMLTNWLHKLGFDNIEAIDISTTTLNEQRSTEWMPFHSLKQFLSADQLKTVEGYPPPKRVVISCTK